MARTRVSAAAGIKLFAALAVGGALFATPVLAGSDDLGQKLTQAKARGVGAGTSVAAVTDGANRFAARVQARPYQRIEGYAAVNCGPGPDREINFHGRAPVVRKFKARGDGRCTSYVYAYLEPTHRGKIKVQLYNRDG